MLSFILNLFLEGALDLKIKKLIAVVSSVLIGCHFYINEYSWRTIDRIANKDGVAEAIIVTMFIAASFQLGWENLYDKNIY